ncbi:polysaccharide biosynthesis tyrosine autokinase [Metapseudomonas boanensis]|uniref:Polysaccharide biosynthesis tyrosine autokinase n=1 Tax=Metapseudomonas boanensis TaxID=2822138 RepID=A0ABS5XDJ2_9GAMM|nr:polysaccharide biosynthesis tyrosine autokinase [Pseudomonas boanensis]MBT8765763.1 polysaccharide biosynthesis tyrosine autokinase [Pseudomonas boanensis]
MTSQNSLPVQDIRDDDDDIDLLALLGTLLDSKWLIIGITSFFTVMGVAYAVLTPPVYQANALVQVEEKKGGMAALTGMSEITEMFGGTSAAVTEIELLKSRAVLGQAVENLKLDIIVEPNYFPLFGQFMARRFQPDTPREVAEPLFGLSSFAWGGETLDIFQLEVPDSYLGQGLTLQANGNGAFTLLNEDDETLLTGHVGEQIEQNGFKLQIATLDANAGAVFNVTKQRRLTTILQYQEDLGASERGKESGIIGLSLESEDPAHATNVLDEVSRLYVLQNVQRNSAEAAQSLEFLQGQLPEVRKQLEKAEAQLNAYQTSARSVDITIETKAVLDQIVALETLISEQKLKRAEMERRFTRQHPSYQALITQMGQLEQQKRELTKRVENLPETQQELLRLTRDMQVTTEIYTQLLNKSQELDIVRAGTVGNVRIIDSADANVEKPVKPKKPLIVLIATLLGGLIAVAYVLVRKALNRGVEDPDVIEQMGLPVYASIPHSKEQAAHELSFKGKGNASSGSHLLAVTNPADLAVESLRSLRTSLHFATLEAKNNILMISGPSPSVGKSFVSSNLAAIIAQTGQRVLLVDADMRKGYVHKMFRQEAENGLSDLLAARIELDKAITHTEVENMDLVTRGQIPPNPSELLMHANFTQFLQQASSRYDLVIIDTPPILAVTDAALVGRQAGTSLIVTRFGMNAAKEILLTKRRFEQNGIDLKGAIFNAVERKASAYGYYGNYAYYQYEYKSDKA